MGHFTKTNKVKGTFPFIKQAGAMECGTTCLAMILKYYGFGNVRNFLTKRAGVDLEGTDLYTISELAESFGFETAGYDMSYDGLLEVMLPAIVHYNGNHFVVVHKLSENKVWVADPALGKYTLERQEFENKWNGIVLTLEKGVEKPLSASLQNELDQDLTDRKQLWEKFYLPSLAPLIPRFKTILIATFILQLLRLALPLFTQAIIDEVLVNDHLKLLYAILIGMILVFISQTVLGYSRNILLSQFNINFEYNFFSRLFKHFLSLSQSYFDRHKREDFINRFQENLKMRKLLNPGLVEQFVDFVFIFLYLIILMRFHVYLGLLAVGYLIVYGVLIIVFFPRLKNQEQRIFGENMATLGMFMDTLLGIQNVKLLGVERLKFWKWKGQYTRNLNSILEAQKSYSKLRVFLNSVYYLGQASVYWMGAYLTFEGNMSIGQYVAFVAVFMIVLNSVRGVNGIFFVLTELSVTFSRINDVLSEPTDDVTNDNKQTLQPYDSVDFVNVSFSYGRDKEHPQLQNLNFSIPTGAKVGIVGRNGSGKSTLIKILAGLYPGYDGHINFGELELRQVRNYRLRQLIGVIPQDVFVFDGTIKENILMGKPSASDEEVIAAAIDADLHDFVKSQYLGYNQKVGENGIKLSGGQQLKLAFARLFLSSPDIIILDEASSSLDVETEKKIMSRVKSKYEGKTIISVAHRLHTLRDSDLILVLDEGSIIEKGTHSELMDSKGLYYSFSNTYINF